MNLAKEAAYLYLYSKELMKNNKRIKKLSRKAEKHVHKHNSTSDQKKKEKHKKKHHSTTQDIKELLKKHNNLIGRIKHHILKFHEALRKQHKL